MGTYGAIGMMLVFGFITFRNFREGRLFWALVSGLGCLLGAAVLWVQYMKANDDGRPAPAPSATEAPVFGDYQPETQ
jgi:hypothetical protein